MSDPVEDAQDANSRRAVWSWLLWLSVALIVYVLSTGPILRLMRTNRIPTGSLGIKVVDVVYRPFDWAEKWPGLARPLGMYWHLWAPELYDSRGKQK